MKYIYMVMMLFLIIGCKSVEKNTKISSNNNINFNEGWVNENKFVATSIGYPNGFSVNKEDAKNSAFNAALALSKVKIENAFIKELPNKNDNGELKSIVEKYIKIEYSNFIDDRYYQIKTTVEYNNLLSLLREGNIKEILN